ncbi:hypothetical protein SAMN06265360_102191 [Haloechinothrix alba]|uniref:Uncharacterized protein n=1 Tax=Haloechinothrix alba TaxID=664784 RepID=A0A238VFB1_9PSEU|nr:hypothetical protein [Haloechinothrix alba]SNR33082.1 hypothetical protein SAMN06265360_102191 [Haloechinothrix alba]
MGRRDAGQAGGYGPAAPGIAHEDGIRRSRRNRHVPATDLLAREGRPIDEDDGPVLGEAVASVRRGMLGVAAALVVVAGGAPVVHDALFGGESTAGSEDGHRAETRDESPAEGRDTVEPASSSKTTTSTPSAEPDPAEAAPPEEPEPRQGRDSEPHQQTDDRQPSGSAPDWREEWQEYVPDQYEEYAEDGSEYQRRYWGE